MSDSPNIVVIGADTLRRDHLGAYGNPWIKTPHLDEFARSSVLFENYSDEEPEAGYEEVLAEVPRPQRGFLSSSSSVVGPGLFCHRHTRPTPKTG